MNVLLVIAMVVLIACIARRFERRWPIAIDPVSEVIEDWKVVGVNAALAYLLFHSRLYAVALS